MVVCDKGCKKGFALSEANMKSEYIGKNKKIRRYFPKRKYRKGGFEWIEMMK